MYKRQLQRSAILREAAQQENFAPLACADRAVRCGDQPAHLVEPGRRIAPDVDEEGGSARAGKRGGPVERGGDVARQAQHVGVDQAPALADGPAVGDGAGGDIFAHGRAPKNQALAREQRGILCEIKGRAPRQHRPVEQDGRLRQPEEPRLGRETRRHLDRGGGAVARTIDFLGRRRGDGDIRAGIEADVRRKPVPACQAAGHVEQDRLRLAARLVALERIGKARPPAARLAQIVEHRGPAAHLVGEADISVRPRQPSLGLQHVAPSDAFRHTVR